MGGPVCARHCQYLGFISEPKIKFLDNSLGENSQLTENMQAQLSQALV